MGRSSDICSFSVYPDRETSAHWAARSAQRARRDGICALRTASWSHGRDRLKTARGGEWGLVAPAVFKTVVSARKRRRVGSIPTRLRQHSVLSPVSWVLSASNDSLSTQHSLPRRLRQEPDLHRA